MPGPRIELDKRGIAELLTSRDVQQMLDDKAERVAAAARGRGVRVGGVPGDIALPIVVKADPSSDRAETIVLIDHPSALAVEAKHRLLGSSLDAAR